MPTLRNYLTPIILSTSLSSPLYANKSPVVEVSREQKAEKEKQVTQELEKLRAAAKERYRNDKILLEQFDANNKKFYGPELWEAIATLTHDSAVMLEKHYDGYSSVISGGECLNKLRGWRGLLQRFGTLSVKEKNSVTSGLVLLRDSCGQKLEKYKQLKKDKEIKREKNLDALESDTLREGMNDLFADNPDLLSMLSATADSRYMYCHPKGGIINATWFFGASASLYRFTCRTRLGTRMQYAYTGASANMGWSIFGGKFLDHQHRYIPETDSYIPLEYRLPYDSSRVKVRPDLNIMVGFVVGAGFDLNGLVAPPVGLVGAGYTAGLGLSTLFKVRDLPPDYRLLYQMMGMDFHN